MSAGFSAATLLTPLLSFGNEEALEPAVVRKNKGEILTEPYLQNLTGNSVTVMWVVKEPSYSYVEYGETENPGKIARTIEDGLVMADNTLNKIHINGLKPGTKYYYKVISKKIKKYQPYNIKYGETLESKIYSFTTMPGNKETVSMSILNDLHNHPGSISNMLQFTDKNSMDFLFFNGDILNHTDSEVQIVKDMLGVTSVELGSKTPFYFVRGNHETRGVYARELKNYFSSPNDKFYYDFVNGPVHFTVIDTGEDKPDDAKVYAGLADFDAYRIEQQKWFVEKVSKSKAFKNAKYRVVLMHIPFYHSDDWYTTLQLRELFAELFNETGVDICISGHTHKYGVYPPEKSKHNYPIIIGGGPANGKRTIINLKADNENLKISMLDDQGKKVGTYKLTAKQ